MHVVCVTACWGRNSRISACPCSSEAIITTRLLPCVSALQYTERKAKRELEEKKDKRLRKYGKESD